MRGKAKRKVKKAIDGSSPALYRSQRDGPQSPIDMETRMSLITDKITAPTDRPRVTRARLLSALADGMADCHATVVAGRAGTGKTLLAAEFAASSGRGVAWYKVDAPEVELHLFLQYLIAAVRGQHSGFGRQTLALAQTVGNSGSHQTPEAEATPLAESFVYEMLLLEASEPLLLVVDDLHLVYDAEWVVPFFSRLLPLLPAESHMLLIGRTPPPAPLWRMRSKQTLCVIEESALLFNTREATELFASYDLPGEQATAALAATRGRASALHTLAREQSAAIAENDGAAAATTSHGERQPANSRLQLVKGFAAKPSLRAT